MIKYLIIFSYNENGLHEIIILYQYLWLTCHILYTIRQYIMKNLIVYLSHNDFYLVFDNIIKQFFTKK